MSKSKKTQLKEKIDIFQLPKSQQYQIRNTYYSYDGCATKEMQKNYISFCDNLITKMCDNGASPKELERALLFCYVIVDCVKYKLSIVKAYDDLDIQNLETKYC